MGDVLVSSRGQAGRVRAEPCCRVGGRSVGLSQSMKDKRVDPNDAARACLAELSVREARSSHEGSLSTSACGQVSRSPSSRTSRRQYSSSPSRPRALSARWGVAVVTVVSLTAVEVLLQIRGSTESAIAKPGMLRDCASRRAPRSRASRTDMSRRLIEVDEVEAWSWSWTGVFLRC